jgi:dolichol-phosphate mannosyltransferase
MKIVVIIPTYNEKENVTKMVPVLDEIFKQSKYDFHVLFVDGNSPDGTAKAAEELSKKYKFVNVILEKNKGGLGAAYTYAFTHAMENMKADIVVEMDADFQHDPKDLPRLVKPIIEDGYDYVIGSRFTKGGSIPKEWEFYRKFLSVVGNIVSKFVLGIFNVNDFTTGFKASRVKGFVDILPLDKILSAGFAYKIDLLFKMHKLNAKILEIPIAFGMRDKGASKMENNNMMDTLKVEILLRVYEHKSFVKFVVVGFAGLFVDATLFNIFRVIPSISPAIGAFISGTLAMLTTFTLNNYWSFGDRKLEDSKDKLKGIVLYFASSYVPILLRARLVHWFIELFGNTFIVTNGAFFIGILFGLVWNFTVYSRIIWKKAK